MWSRNLLRRLIHYVSALCFLLIAATVYQLVLTPWLQPPLVAPVAVKPDGVMVLDDTLPAVFAADAWQRGVCKRLQTTNGTFMLLFQNWEQTDDDRWKLWPITVVIGRDSDGEVLQEPVILEAELGAEIRFTESLDVLSGNAPPIHDGRMNGIVEIKRPSKDPSQSLLIRTANVGIDNRKVWTTEAIQMRFGDARVIGRDMTLHLANATGTLPSSRHASAVLDRMELIYLDEMVLPLPDGPLWDASTEATSNQPVSSGTSPAILTLRCGGRVEYDFALDKLSLHNAVSLVHQVSEGQEDRFDCDALELILRDPTNRDMLRATPLAWLNQITAYGSPATILLASFDAAIAAEHIDLRALDGLLTAGGRTGVEVRRSGLLARFTQLAYQFNPNDPKQIGELDAFGAGRITMSDASIPLREVRWTESLSIKPQQKITADDLVQGVSAEIGIWIDGAVEAMFNDGGRFQASAVESAIKSVVTRDSSGQTRQGFKPRWLKASRKVHLDTNAIAADTHLLQLVFVDPSPIQNRHTPPGSSPAESADHAGAMRSWIVEPARVDTIADPVARPRPVIRGDSISAELEYGGDGIQARDLTVVGSVELSHTIVTGNQTLPARLTGEQLRWRDGGGDDVLQLGSGIQAPARFELGDGYFVGPLIQIWPAENLIEINQAGEFCMPTAVLPTGLSEDSAEASIKWIKPPHCHWQEAMRFDGRTAVLSGGVSIAAELVNGSEPWELSLSGEQLHVMLDDRVQIENVQTIRNASVQQITLLQSDDRAVMVHADQRAADGVMEARHILLSPKLTLMPLSGKLIGQGPGWYRAWIRSPAKGLLATGPTTPPAPSHHDGTRADMTGIHLMYHDLFEGDLDNKNLTFFRGVRVGVRNVASWDQTFDVAQMDALTLGDSTLDCDQLRLGVTATYRDDSSRIAGMPVPWEMEASTGVVFRTRNDKGLLEGTAARAFYSSLKDMFTIDGAPNTGSNVRWTNADGQPGPNFLIREMSVRPRTMDNLQMRLQGGTLGSLPSNIQRK